MSLPPPLPGEPDEAPSPSVSWAKKKIIAVPRVSLPAPGARSVFGRGVVRRFRATQGGGCFLLLLLAIGSAIFLFGAAGTVGPWKEPLLENGDPRFFLALMGFGTVFSLISLRMLQITLTGAENESRRKGGDPSTPWAWDHPWRTDWMAPDYSGGGTGTVLGRVAFLGLLGMFNVAWTSDFWLFKAIVGVFDLFGLLILYDSFQKVYQWLRFRHPVAIWPRIPVFLGERLEGRVAFSRPVACKNPAQVTLRCMKDEWTVESVGESGQEQRTLQPFASYQETHEVPAPAGGLDAIDFSFELPRDRPGTNLTVDEATYWQVTVIVPIFGPDLEAVFLAPVYKKR